MKMAGLEIAEERDAGNVGIKRFYSRVLGAMQALQTAYQAWAS